VTHLYFAALRHDVLKRFKGASLYKTGGGFKNWPFLSHSDIPSLIYSYQQGGGLLISVPLGGIPSFIFLYKKRGRGASELLSFKNLPTLL
jgi:hypothetical protein